MLESVRADGEPTGASVTLTGNGELAVESVTAQGDGTPRVVLDFPNVRSKTPADIVVGQGPISAIHVSTTGVTPFTRVVVDLVRPASYRVIPAEDGGKDLKIIFDDTEGRPATSAIAIHAMRRWRPLGATLPGRQADPIGALLAAGRKQRRSDPQPGARRSAVENAAGSTAARSRRAAHPVAGRLGAASGGHRRRRRASTVIRSRSIFRAPICERCCAPSPTSAA